MFLITAKFFFDNGEVKRVDWTEDTLYKKVNVGGQDTEVPLNLEEVGHEFRKLFLKYMKSGDVLTVPNIMGKTSVIPFGKIYYAEVSAADYVPGQRIGGEAPPNPKPAELRGGS